MGGMRANDVVCNRGYWGAEGGNVSCVSCVSCVPCVCVLYAKIVSLLYYKTRVFIYESVYLLSTLITTCVTVTFVPFFSARFRAM